MLWLTQQNFTPKAIATVVTFDVNYHLRAIVIGEICGVMYGWK